MKGSHHSSSPFFSTQVPFSRILFIAAVASISAIGCDARPKGLAKMGRKSYQTSVLQMLHLTEGFTQELSETIPDGSDINRMKLAMRELFADLDRPGYSASEKARVIQPYLRAINPVGTDFTEDRQQDAANFVQSVLRHFDQVTSEKLMLTDIGYTLSVQDLLLGREISSDQQYLTLILDRMDYDAKKKRTTKKMNEITIDQQITVNGLKYGLYGAVIHQGKSLLNGQYWAVGKKSSEVRNKRAQWWEFRDKQVTESNLGDIQNNDQTQTPYLLFYVRLEDDNAHNQPARPMNDHHSPGKTGLVNTGNSCYQNSVLQMLHLTSDLRNQVVARGSHGINQPVLRALADIFADLSHGPTNNNHFSDKTLNLCAVFSEPKPYFDGRTQQDAHQFLIEMMDIFHEAELDLDMFRLSVQIDRKVPPLVANEQTHYFPSQVDDHTMISLQMNKENRDVQSMIQEYQKPETMNDFKHEGIQRESIKTDRITHTSKYLIIQLVRFHSQKVSKNKSVITKINDSVEINQQLTVAGKRYDLYGTVIHQGDTLKGGHYTTMAREPEDAVRQRDKWWIFNDQDVQRAQQNEVKHLLSTMKTKQSDPGSFNRTPYILFYVLSDDNHNDGGFVDCTDDDQCISEEDPSMEDHSSESNSSDQPSLNILNQPMGLFPSGKFNDYQNAVLQMLHLSEDFQNAFINFNQGNTQNDFKRVLSQIFDDLNVPCSDQMSASKLTQDLQPTLKHISNQHTNFTQDTQQDAAKFLQSILRVTDKDITHHLLSIQMQTNIFDLTKQESQNGNTVTKLMLTLPIKNNIKSVSDGLRELQADRHEESKLISNVITDSGKYLFIHLDRHSDDIYHPKITQAIDIDETITVNNKEYVLYAMVVHRGDSLQSGNYYTIGRSETNAQFGIIDHQLWRMENSMVTLIEDESEVLSLMNPTQVDNYDHEHTPYLLAYVQTE